MPCSKHPEGEHLILTDGHEVCYECAYDMYAYCPLCGKIWAECSCPEQEEEEGDKE